MAAVIFAEFHRMEPMPNAGWRSYGHEKSGRMDRFWIRMLHQVQRWTSLLRLTGLHS